MRRPSNDPCPCGSGEPYVRCCLSRWLADVLDELSNEPAYAGAGLIDSISVEPGQGPHVKTDAESSKPGSARLDAPMRISFSEAAMEASRRLGERGLFDRPRAHPSAARGRDRSQRPRS